MIDERALGTETPLELAREQLFQALVLSVLLGWAVCCCFSMYDKVSCKPENRPGLLTVCPLHVQCWDGRLHHHTHLFYHLCLALLLSLFDILSWGLRDYPSQAVFPLHLLNTGITGSQSGLLSSLGLGFGGV